MSKGILAIGGYTVLAVLLGAGASVAAPPVHQASGGGSVDWPDGRVSYGFNARVDADGQVKGQASFAFRNLGVEFQVDINCLVVVGHDAWLGGTIVSSSNPALLGEDIVWRVQDNGEGRNAPPDQTSPTATGVPPGSCNQMPPLSLRPWTNGNVQVK